MNQASARDVAIRRDFPYFFYSMTTQQHPDIRRKNFLLRMEQFIRKHGLLSPGSHLVLGISGGLDSMAMLDALCLLRTQWRLRLSVAHVNFRLRGKASDADERFVIRAAEKYDLPVYVRRADTTAKIGRAHV